MLLEPTRRFSRSRLVGLFWPEEPEQSARRKLSQAMWRIRSSLEPIGYGELIKGDGEEYLVDTSLPVEVDALEFLEGTSAPVDRGSEASIRRFLEAVELYRGEFLHGYYHDWVVEEQRQFADAYLRALTQAVHSLKAVGANDDALIYARKLTWQDPLREEAHREVMRLCMLLDRPLDALRQYEQLEELLYRELGADPDPSTRTLFEMIADQRVGAEAELERAEVAGRSVHAPFVGRQRERASGVDVIEQTMAGRGTVVLVEGDPGVGKTRLLEEVAHAATWRGVEVLRGSATSDTPVPFGLVRGALAMGMSALRAEQLVEQVDPLWLTEVTRVVPQLAEWLPDLQPAAPLSSADSRDRMIEAIKMVMAALGRITPHIVVFDDLHWADQDSIDVIRHLTTSSAMRRTSIFVAFRGAEGRARAAVWDVLRELDRAGAKVMQLDPLDSAEVEQLVRWAAEDDRRITAAAGRIRRETGGNPLFVIETTRALVESGGLREEEGLPVTEGIRGVIGDRLSRLSADEIEVIGALATRSEPATSKQLGQWCELPRSGVLQSLLALMNRRIVVESDDGYSFLHDQMRRVAYEVIPSEDAARFHKIIAETLETDEGVEPSVLAHHLEMAGQRARAFRHWVRAGQNAAAIHAYASAAHFYELAVSDVASLEDGVQPEGYVEALAEYEAVLATRGDRERQAEVLEEWMTLVGGDEAATVEPTIRLARFRAETGDYSAAIRLAESAANDCGAIGLSDYAAQLVIGRTLHWSGDLDRAVSVLRKTANRVPEDVEVAIAYGSVLGETQRYREARTEFERVLDVSRRIGDRRHEAEALGLAALVAYELGDSAAVQTMFDDAIQACTEIGYTRARAVAEGNAGISRHSLGHTAEALRLLQASRRSNESVGNGRGAGIAMINEAMIRHLVLGDDELARELIEASEPFSLGQVTGPVAHAHELLASIAARHQRYDDALLRIEAALDIADKIGNERRRGYTLRTRARLHLDRGDLEAAIADVHDARAIASPDLLTHLDAIEAMVRGQLGDAEAAWELSARSVKLVRAGISLAWMIYYNHGLVAEMVGRGEDAAGAFLEAGERLDSALVGLDPELRKRAIDRIRPHADITRRWRLLQPDETIARIARVGIPTGRPLEDHEYVDVRWRLEGTARHGEAGTSPESDRRSADSGF